MTEVWFRVDGHIYRDELSIPMSSSSKVLKFKIMIKNSLYRLKDILCLPESLGLKDETFRQGSHALALCCLYCCCYGN